MKKNSPLQLVLAWLYPIAWASLIFTLSAQSSLPSLDESLLNFLFTKSAHIFVYFVLYFLVWKATDQTVRDTNTSMRTFFPLLICLLYAASDEIHQSFVPGRSATLRDVGYDMLGTSIAFMINYKYI